jgi:peptidoglycan/xylan/chitin deacetylase (PgdA/CDA1 family)
VLDKHSVKATISLNSAVCEHYPIIVEECKKRGYEFIAHGITNSQPLSDLSEAEERNAPQVKF